MSESTAALLAFLSEPAAEPVASEGELAAYEDAAAVLAAIDDPDKLRPFGSADPGAARRVLGDRLIPATGRKFAGRVMLDPRRRYAAIARLAKAGSIELALRANPSEREGVIQQQLEAYLLGDAPALEEQSLEELDATRQVAVWLRDAVRGIPDPDAVERQAAYRRLLEPFEAIAGDGLFRGRKRELDDLRDYVGVLAPSSIVRRIARAAFQWPEGKPRGALSIFGPGGVGKSALVARFMLEHTRVPEEGRIPFAYLDFDTGLDVGDPFRLVIQMIRQIDAQFTSERFADLRASAESSWASYEGADARTRYQAAQSLLGDVLKGLAAVLGPRPYLIVLDTFEEVQYRGEARAFPLWDMLTQLQSAWPFLRVVVSGRAPVETLRLAGRAPQAMELGTLDDEAAAAFLRSQGIKDPALARKLVRQYGGVPLSLKLVASLLARDPRALDTGAAPDRGRLFMHASDELVQGQLYERVLSHVGDERVRRLAHPGLVLRRITPDLIREVLNEPCQLGVVSAEDAAELFEALRRETSLVSLDASDGSLVNRSDLRRVMLKLLVASEPARVERIRRAAIDYYDRQTGLRAIAEAAYHRLHLGLPVDEAVLKDPEVRASIQTAVVELPGEVQQRLAALGFQVPKDVLERASQAEQEASLAALVEEYLPNGPSSEQEAARVLASTPLDLDHPSPLFRAAARVALQADRPDDAARWIERGLEEAATANATLLSLRLLQERAWLEHRTGGMVTPATRDALADYAARHGDAQATLQHRLHAFDAGLASAAAREDAFASAAAPADDPAPAAEPWDAGLALRALGTLLGVVSADDVWALAPAIRGPLHAATSRREGDLLATLQVQVLSESGPFRFAGFHDPGVQRLLESALSPSLDPFRFGMQLAALLDAWPYRILAVTPPIARRSEQLYESAV